jgi:predicted flap endonuclease-1-like 5' DNA nuclease
MTWAWWIWLLLILVLLSLFVLIVLLLMWVRRRQETPSQVFQAKEPSTEPTIAWTGAQEAAAQAADTTGETAAETKEAIAGVEDIAVEAATKIEQDVEQAEKETAEPVARRMQEPVVGEPPPVDDLKIIEGIGPKISSVFQAAGITTLAQLAATDVDALKQILTAANIRLGDPSTWPEQAGLAAEGKWEELAALQDSLKGGRRV